MEDSGYISKILHGKVPGLRKLEARYKTLDIFLDDAPENIDYDEAERIGEEIAYIRYEQRNGYLKRVIRENRKLNSESIDNIVLKMQNYRTISSDIKNEHDKVSYLEEMIDGKHERYIERRLEAIDKRLDSIMDCVYSMEDLDSLRYLSMKIKKNSYMQKKIKDDPRLYALVDNIEKKINRCLERNRKHYTKGGSKESMLSEICKKGKSGLIRFEEGAKNIFRNRVVKYAAVFVMAAGLGAGSVYVQNNKVENDAHDRIEYVKRDKGLIGRTLEYLKYHKPYDKGI